MKKDEFMEYFRKLPTNLPLNPRPVPYKHRGSTFAEDGIRITGSKDFIEEVLSHLHDFRNYENGSTRLSVAFQESKDRETGRNTGSYNCYLQVHQRGRARI